MKKLLLAPAFLLTAVCATAQLDVTGGHFTSITPPASSGLQSVYVVEELSETKFVYHASSANVQVQWYGKLGGGYAEDVPILTKVPGTNDYVIPTALGPDDHGFIITDGSKRLCFWVVNYANYPFAVSGITAAESDCDRIALNVSGSAPEMPYYTVNGRRELVDRKISLEYNTLVYDSESHTYNQTLTRENLTSAEGTIYAMAPLCDTDFTLYPDRFASAWGHGNAVKSSSVQAIAVKAETKASQTARDADNEQKVESEGLGGSAPCEIEFSAAVTDAAIYRRWEIASTPDFVDTSLTFDQLDFTYTFTEAGTNYVRFTANNADGTCEYLGETYTVSIGESRLECPNAFSPGTSEGVNDEWKVSYRSIVSFDCQIFNRWGQKMATLTDPSQGWDGKHNGKVVKSGVYFYVIKATGSDGKEYKLSGDINIISSRRNPDAAGSSAEE